MRNRLAMMLAGIVITTVAGILGGPAAHAQLSCQCRRMSVVVAPDILCSVRVCVTSDAGTECHTFAPGEIGQLPCLEGGRVVILDGCERRVQIDLGQCVYPIPGPAPCCLTACLNIGPDGWHVLHITKTPNIGHCFCPGG